jgi:hypothetical protein
MVPDPAYPPTPLPRGYPLTRGRCRVANDDQSSADVILVGNLVGFGCVSCMDLWGVFSGEARQVAKLFLVIHLLMTLAFLLAWRAAGEHR